MSTLLEISDDIAALESLLYQSAEEGGDITAVEETLSRWFSEIGAERDTKIDYYAALIRSLELRSAARLEESERLGRRAKIDGAQADFLRERLKQFFSDHGMSKVETRRYCVGIAKNGGKAPLLIDCEPERLPQEYQSRVVSTKANTEAIRAVLEAGRELAFARIGERGTRLSIR